MKSRFSHLRSQAEDMRRSGRSLKSVAAELSIPQSTLSGWFQGIILTEEQRAALKANWRKTTAVARTKAAKTHRLNKRKRVERIQKQVRTDYEDILSAPSPEHVEIALAMLYLGEGTKQGCRLGLGNSDPAIVKFYVGALMRLYGVDTNSFRADLHLRMDQDGEGLKRFWSRKIGLPLNRFRYILRDKRTAGKPTYEGYKGVCYVDGGGVEIQRRLLYLARVLCTGRFARD